MSHFLSVFLLVIIFWWLHVIIYHRAPLSSVVLSTAPAPSASFHQDYGQLHKHFTDKDGQLFTDKAKVLLAAATAWAWVCVFSSACVRERAGAGMTKRALNVWPLLVLTPAGLSARTHLSNALSAAPTLDCTICLSNAKYSGKNKEGSLCLLTQSHLHLLVLSIAPLLCSSHSPSVPFLSYFLSFIFTVINTL